MEPIKVTKPVNLEDGKYEGEIKTVDERTTPQGYEYIDIGIEEKNSKLTLKYGCPKSGSTEGKLMKLCGNFTEVKEDSEINPRDLLVGKKVSFLVNKEKSKDGKEYARIAENSVKPINEEKQGEL